ncbi:MAG TPA: hypothetical protein VF897_02690 [Roseiflexaceae bacterium]
MNELTMLLNWRRNLLAAAAVRDEFQNELAASRRAAVSLRILPGPNENQPQSRPRSRHDRPTSTPVAPTTPNKSEPVAPGL